MRFKKLFSLAMILLCLCAGEAYAQFETASIGGRVMDSTGAVLVGAKITVTNIDTNVAISRVSDKAGEYIVPALRAGVYRIVATMDGFHDAITENVHLLVGTNQTINHDDDNRFC